ILRVLSCARNSDLDKRAPLEPSSGLPPELSVVSAELEEIVRSLPGGPGTPAVAPLRGGLSNASFKVTDDEGTYVARLGRDFPFHHVWRRREAAASRAAEVAGLGPRIQHVGDGLPVSALWEGGP